MIGEELLVFELRPLFPGSDFRDDGSIFGKSDEELGATGKLGEAGGIHDPLYGADTEVEAILLYKFRDLPRRESLCVPEGDDLFTGLGGDFRRSSGSSESKAEGDVEFPLTKAMAEEMDVGRGESEAASDDGGGEPFDEGGAKGLVDLMTGVLRVGKELRVEGHEVLIDLVFYKVNSLIVKINQKTNRANRHGRGHRPKMPYISIPFRDTKKTGSSLEGMIKEK